MSFLNANLPIQISVANYVQNDKRDRFIDFIQDVSNANTAVRITPTEYQYTQGKVRNLKMNLYAPICDIEGSCDTNVCNMDGEKHEISQYYFDLTECFATKPIVVEGDDIRYVDNTWSFSEHVFQQIAAMMPAVRKGLARDMFVKFASLVGVHPDGSAEKRVTLTNPTTLGAYPQGLDDIYAEYDAADLMTPYIIGGRPLMQFTRSLQNGGLNALGDRLELYQPENVYYDGGLSASVLNDTVNGEHIFSVDPRVFKFVTFSQNAGMFVTDMNSLADVDLQHNRGNANLIKGTYLDPVTGLLFDLYINYTCDTWVIQLKLIWDMWVLPEYVCQMVGVNGLMHWRTCPQVIIPCPSGSVPPSASAPSVYSWTPGGVSYPYTISTIVLGNRPAFNLNAQVANIADLAAALNNAWGTPAFYVDGSDIKYTGAVGLSGTINNGEVNITFA